MWQRLPPRRFDPASKPATGKAAAGMAPTSTAPTAMERALWRERVSELCAACVDASPAEGPARLRECLALLTLAPEAGFAGAAGLPTVARIEAMLACGAQESAALALLPKGASYLLSRGADDVCLASVVLPLTAEEVTAEGATPALALLAALTASLVLPERGENNPVLADIDGLELPEAHWLN